MSVDAVLIAGPTASGKSGLALELAERLGACVINADSMQVYSELRLLTARPSPADEARLPHHLYGHVSVHERYSAGRYQQEAAAALRQARAQGRIAIFVGGTGLYFDVLTKGLSPIPTVPAEIRKITRERFETLGRDAFFSELARRDSESAAKLRISDTQRILRAADVLEATGRPLSEWQRMSGEPVLEGLALARFVLAPPREELAARIDRRFVAMVEEGALEEAKGLIGLDPALPAAKALGLRQLGEHLEGKRPLDTAIAQAQLATRQYAKRQMTWFRNRMRDWNWLESANLSNIITSNGRELL
jgi:tRNA dimethylallyltransferase